MNFVNIRKVRDVYLFIINSNKTEIIKVIMLTYHESHV